MTLRTSPLAFVRSPRHLEPYLGLSVQELERIAGALDVGSGVATTTLRGKGRERVVTQPADESVRNVQRRILSLLTPAQMALPELVSGYVRGRSSLTNASAHVGNGYLQKFDLADFFPHISVDAARLGFEALGLPAEVALLLARLTTCNGRLPVGFSTSPAVANIACFELDESLVRIAEPRNLTITRYADDIAFSGSEPFDVEADLRRAVESVGHEVNEKKMRTLKRGQPMYVTGLSLSEPDRVRLPRPFKKRLRQELYYIEFFGLDSHAGWIGSELESVVFRLGGQLAYSHSIEPEWSERLAQEYPAAHSQVARMRSARGDQKRQQRLQALADRVCAREDPRAASYEPTCLLR
jgi:hypothetical protein